MGVFSFLFGSRPKEQQPDQKATFAAVASKSEPAYAVIDVETTGVSPKSDRVLEIAIVRVDREGQTVDEFWQRFNPEGPVGATHIHGITDADVAHEPFFHQVSPAIADRIRGLPVVAHNANFDLAFLRAEFTSAGWELPFLPSYCTLDGSYNYLPDVSRRRLIDCCWASGVTLDDAHSALGDARAAAGLLRAYLGRGGQAQSALAEAAAAAAAAGWPSGPSRPPLTLAERIQASGRPRPTRITPSRPKSPALLKQISALSLAEVVDEGAPTGTLAYVELLFDALEDGDIDEKEATALGEVQRAYRLSPSDIDAAHQAFLLALAHKAVDDGHISHDERHELNDMAQLLSVSASKVKAVSDRADAARLARMGAGLTPLPEGWTLGEPLRVGDRVAFTGCDEAHRARLEERASRLGVRVMNNVSKLTVALVEDGSFSGGKLEKALGLGTRRVRPDEFETLLKHLQPARALKQKALPKVPALHLGPDTNAGTRPAPAAVRAWAIANGFDVGTRGRIHSDVFDAYERATA